MKKSIFLFIVMIVFACNNKNKYKHITIIEGENLNGKKEIKNEEKIEEYENDSIASVMAYQYYCISKKIEKDYDEKNIKKYSSTIGFKLLDEKGKIVNINKYLIPSIKKDIEKDIFQEKNIFDQEIDEDVIVKAIDEQFSSLDGHHIKLQEFIISELNDPDSYEHVSSKFKREKDCLDVVLTFRGKNKFNATITSTIHAKCNLITGEVIDIVE